MQFFVFFRTNPLTLSLSAKVSTENFKPSFLRASIDASTILSLMEETKYPFFVSIVPCFLPVVNRVISKYSRSVFGSCCRILKNLQRLWAGYQSRPKLLRSPLQTAIFQKNILTGRKFCATMQNVVLWREWPLTGQGRVFGSFDGLFFRFFPADLLRFLQNGPAYFTCSHQSRKHFRDHTCVNAQSALKKDSLRFIIQL